MPTQDDFSSLPSATLRAALIAAEKREKRDKGEKERRTERKKLLRQMGDIQKRLDELEKEANSSEAEPEGKVAVRSQESQRKKKRLRSESLSDSELLAEDRCTPWSIAKVRRVDLPGPSRQRCVHRLSLMKHRHRHRTCSLTCTRCQRMGVRCERNKTSDGRVPSCQACRRAKARCEAPDNGATASREA